MPKHGPKGNPHGLKRRRTKSLGAQASSKATERAFGQQGRRKRSSKAKARS